MQTSVTKDFAANTLIATFTLNSGEKIVRHKHDYAHTNICTQGQAKVEIALTVNTANVFTITADGSPHVLPANLYHQITALVNNTIIVAKHPIDAISSPFEPLQSGNII